MDPLIINPNHKNKYNLSDSEKIHIFSEYKLLSKTTGWSMRKIYQQIIDTWKDYFKGKLSWHRFLDLINLYREMSSIKKYYP